MITVRVNVGTGYDVVIGAGAIARLANLIPPGARRAAVVTQQGIGVAVDSGVEQREFVIPDGERAKTTTTVEKLCRDFVSWGMRRGDCVVAVGGGVVTDTAGFAAAVYLRGVAFVNVPTTLLAMVDAAIGGKTGVNLPEGKNLVGAFWQPSAVLCDTDVLDGLPEAEMRSGLGEVAKCELLAGERFDALAMEERIARCVALKAEIVAADEREVAGDRAVLNYGHTLAHALETTGGYGMRHGEAVGVGLVFAARLAEKLARITRDRVDEHVKVVSGYGLPVEVPHRADVPALIGVMLRDKKGRSDESVTFVLDGPSGVELVDVAADTVTEMLVGTTP